MEDSRDAYIESEQLIEEPSSSLLVHNDDPDQIVVLEDDDLHLRHRSHKNIQNPLKSVTDILREAENIMTDGPMQVSTTKDNQQVILDKVDVEYSPRKCFQPIEIVVRHNKVVEQPYSSDEDESTQTECKGRKRLSTLHEEKESTSPFHQLAVVPTAQNTDKAVQAAWTRGHRRAWSMPNAKGEKMTLAVIHDNETMESGNKTRRRIVRYKLQPHTNRNDLLTEPRAGGGNDVVRFNMELDPDDDDNELEVEINEEEVVIPNETGAGARTVIKRFWEARWKATNFDMLPDWLQDNEYLRTGHRPPIPSFSSCFKSIFALHSETGNIWTHMYGCVAFIGVGLWFSTRPSEQVQWADKLVFSAFFLGAITCLGMSFIFHTVACHSDRIGRLFSKLDYTGISLLIVGSFIPWIYYAFYCRPQPMVIYTSMITILGISAMIVSLWDKFAEPLFRPLRAGVFVAMGLSAIVPAAHLLVVDGVDFMVEESNVHWMILMGAMYICGALIYAIRIPERCFPGKCDLWFQSHQLFHSFVVAAAFVHFHAISDIAMKKLEKGSCPEQLLKRYGVETHASWLGTLLGLDPDPNITSWTPADLNKFN